MNAYKFSNNTNSDMNLKHQNSEFGHVKTSSIYRDTEWGKPYVVFPATIVGLENADYL